jgi:hypothetical protein
MKQIIEIIIASSGKSYLDEDDNILNITLYKGAPLIKINELEKRYGVHIASELKELLLFSNGINLFGIEILSIESMEFFHVEKKIAFHNWGNGDFDVIDEAGQIYFSNHSIEALILVSSSLSNWIVSVIEEIEIKGTLLHPIDYSNRENEEGVYRKILDGLN